VSRIIRSVLVCLLGAVSLAPGVATAHSGKQSYLSVSVYGDRVAGMVEIPVADLSRALGIDFPTAESSLGDALQESSEIIVDYVDERTALGDDSGTWDLDYGEISALGSGRGAYMVLLFDVARDFDSRPLEFDAVFSVIVDEDAERDNLLLIADYWPGGISSSEESIASFTMGQTEQSVVLEAGSTATTVSVTRELGSVGLRTSIDLLLVVMALAAVSVLVPGRPSTATPTSLARAVRRVSRSAGLVVVAMVAAFVASGVASFEPPARPTGLLVAAMLGVAAVFLAVGRFRPQVRSFSSVIYVLGGAVIGVGLAEPYVPDERNGVAQLPALLGFAAGAVIATLIGWVIVAILMLMLRRTRYMSWCAAGLSLIFLAYSALFIANLVVGDDWSLDQVTNPLGVWPRNYWFVLLGAAGVAGVRHIEQRAGRLLPDASPEDPPTMSETIDNTDRVQA